MAANTAPSVPPTTDYPHAAALTRVPVAPVSRCIASAPSASPDVAPLTRAHVRFSSEEVLGSNASMFNSALTRTVNNNSLGRSPPFPALLVQPPQPQPLCEEVTSEQMAITLAREGKECASASVLVGGGGAAGSSDDEADKDEDDEDEDDEEGLFCERVVVIRGSEQAVSAAERTLRRIVGRQPIRTRETSHRFAERVLHCCSYLVLVSHQLCCLRRLQ